MYRAFENSKLTEFALVAALLMLLSVNTPLIHPVSAGQPCADDDGTAREAYDELVAKMKALDKKHPNFYSIDVNNKGEHNLKHKDFNNFDHLNTKGAKKLTLMLNDFIKAIDSRKKISVQKARISQVNL